MFFRNLTIFRFPGALDLSDLQALLGEARLKPVGPLELSARGFVSPLGAEHDALVTGHIPYRWLALGGEDRLLPAAVVDKELQGRLDQVFSSTGRRPGGRARKSMKDDLIHELLPKAFVKPMRMDAMLDLQHHFIAVDTSGRRAAETFVSMVRQALGSFPALPLNAEVSPRAVMTGWVAGEPLPDGLALGEDCILEDPADGGATVKCYRLDLGSEEVQEHLAAGRQATRLALSVHDVVQFELDECLVIRKFRLLDGAIDRLEEVECNDLVAELDARFALMAGTIGALFAVLDRALKFSEAD